MIVADTNVLSELMRPQPNPCVARWARSFGSRELYTTAITIAEIGYGIERLPNGHRKRKLAATAEDVFAAFAEDVLTFDVSAARNYGVIASDRERSGLPIDGFDGQIAAICATRRAALATRNLGDFRDTGIELINPWEV